MKPPTPESSHAECGGPSQRTGVFVSHRTGVTLIEVLVSILIMAIGVGMLATLFPISVARTAQASQLTQAVFLRNNAEAMIESNPNFLATNYGGAVNVPLGLSVIDPLGVAVAGANSLFATQVTRVPSATVPSLPAARQIVMLPDSWSDVFDVAIPNPGTNVTATGVTIPNLSTNFTPWNTANPGNAHYRMVLFDSTNKFAVLRDLLKITGSTTLSWSDGTIVESALPAGFNPVRVRVETQVQRFTWLMTVNKSWVPTAASSNAWEAELNLAVFFNRSFKPAEETPYLLTYGGLGLDNKPGVANVDDDSNGTVDDATETGWLGSDDNRTISLPAGANPYVRKGSYMLETTLLRWYRIVTISQTTGAILLDRDFRAPAQPGTNSYGVFMKGIVDVYPLGVRTGQY